MEAKQANAAIQLNDVLATSEARIYSITNASLRVMADFATRATPYSKFAEKDIVQAVLSEPEGPVARYLAGLIADSIVAVATLDYVRAA